MKRRYAKGTDNVPAMLTPREAILNRNAAELLGRDTIKRLNDHGNMLAKRGVDLASDPTPGPSTENMLGYQMGAADVGRDDRADLLAEANNTFYGGGNAPMPTPTPTPKPRGYQYGSNDVFQRRRMNAASRIQGINFSQNALRGIPSRNAINSTPQGQVIMGSGAGSGGYGYTSGTGSLPPDQNPAYQAALRNNPTPAQRYAQPSNPTTMVGTYGIPADQRAVVSTGANSFRTYDPQGGYIGRTGNAADFLNRQFNPSSSQQPATQAAPAPVTNPPQSVTTTPTSVTVNSTGFQPSGLEANPFAGPPTELNLQPRRYSDYY